ncbi:MAG: AAA family ATPase [Candidatus Sumerlaeia bacterium]|nr:AAA family ATPase [Candidatus Sumerlaeia bacterium]
MIGEDRNSRIESGTVSRTETQWTKLRGSNMWVLSNSAAGKIVSDKFGPAARKKPNYIPIGREVKILMDLVSEGVPVVLTGPPGIGKTTLITMVYHQLGLPLQTFLASSATQAHELMGRIGAGGVEGELTCWIDGKLSLASRAAAGGLVSGFYLDEVIKLPNDIASVLFSVIDSRATLPLPTGEEILMGQNLKCVFSYNPTKGRHLEDALRSRMTAIRMGYAPIEVETKVLLSPDIGNLGGVRSGAEIARGLVTFANVIRYAHGFDVDERTPKPSDAEKKLLQLLPGPPSTRSLVVASRMIARGEYNPQEALELFVVPSLLQDTHDFEMPSLIGLMDKLCKELIPDVKLVDSHRSVLADFNDGVTEQTAKEYETSLIAAQVMREWKKRG